MSEGQKLYRRMKRRKRHMQRAIWRIYRKVRNIVDDVHKKHAKWLCENYRAVLLPHFDKDGRMKNKDTRKVGKKVVRRMLDWAHGRFRKRLLNKAREYPWCRVIICTEEYTSKTCGHCGRVRGKLGGTKVFHCADASCPFQGVDRDLNGARNILIKYLTECGLVPHVVASHRPDVEEMFVDADLTYAKKTVRPCLCVSLSFSLFLLFLNVF